MASFKFERTNEWIQFELVSEEPRTWKYSFRGCDYFITQDTNEFIYKKITNEINNILDAEMLEDDMKYYKQSLQFK
jgi:hypothetical protein